ncbi:MAG: OmpA/MotB family protein [Myxococcaceae bacterium]
MSLRSKPPAHDEADGNPLHDATWLYSFADLMTQLLLFSILMVTALGLKEMEAPVAPAQAKPKTNLDQTVREVEKFVMDSGLSGAMSVDRGADRLIIRMKSVLLFHEGQAALTPRAEEVLGGVVAVLSRVPSPIRVEGHTDDVPMRSAAFESNWELSSARAISVVRYLEDRGLVSSRLSVAGYGEFHPIIANDSAEHRAMNRRVELVVLGGE